jgi:hypothetical protein
MKLSRFHQYDHMGKEIYLKNGKWYWHDETEDEYGPYDRYDLAFYDFRSYCRCYLDPNRFWKWWYKKK